jgi:hypothetical protein
VYMRRDDSNYDVLEQCSTSGRIILVAPKITKVVDTLPAGTVPAELGHKRKNGVRRVYWRPRSIPIEAISQDQSSVATFSQYVEQQPRHIKKLLQYCDLTNEAAAATVSAFSEGKLDVGSDGGLLDLRGTFGFVCGNMTTTEMTGTSKGIVPGSMVIMSSTRAELCGIFAAVTYIRLALAFYHVLRPKKGFMYTLYCDSKAALSIVTNSYFEEFGTIWRCRANYDLEVAI